MRDDAIAQHSSFWTRRDRIRNDHVESFQFCHPSQLNVPSHEWPVRALLRENQGCGQLKRISGSKWMHGQETLSPGANGVEAINLEPMHRQRIEPPYGLHGPSVFQVTGSNPTPYCRQHLHPGQGPDPDTRIGA
jgi:hypothetical protein